MKTKDTFGVSFVLRQFETGNCYVYARISVNRSKAEIALKQPVAKQDWNYAKGCVKPKTEPLRQLNSLLEEVRAKLMQHYQQLRLGDEVITADAVKRAFLRADQGAEEYTLLWLMREHNRIMQGNLRPGTMKNYYTTEKYLERFLAKKYPEKDILLRKLTFEFITHFEHFVRTNPVQAGGPCTNNGTMKHMERLKKIALWAVKNGWMEKNPFEHFQLKFKHKERDFLTQDELKKIESQSLSNEMMNTVRELFVFGCYTGLAYADLISLKHSNIITGNDGVKWLSITRTKTDTPAYVPLLTPALFLMGKYLRNPLPATLPECVFPRISNQEMNRNLKLIAEICGIGKHLTLHLARHTFATTVTLLNGVPIESISKMLGHTKLTTTMIYARVTQSKIGMDMALLQHKLDAISKSA